ncbi:inosine/xanthosine triphosphatase [Paraglaciecola sp. 2405UD69-4]|uniref:inosine/xanthosine triphosphatase n=1 Tax=Paraglaciecola sp. 2405UD69-4 TaxID=3391836 RepID=UPI0039C94896
MIKIVVGSTNPVKINAVKKAMVKVLATNSIECVGISAPSGVAEQPMSCDETLEGAINRVKYCQQDIQADYYVAIEGGVHEFEYGPATFAYVVIANHERQSVGRSSNLPLPPKVYQALKNGEELGHVMDRLFATDNVKQKEGAIGLLTNKLATRESVYTLATTLAMAPFINPELY